jgi:cytochrome oxidase assembly protein ShyY1
VAPEPLTEVIGADDPFPGDRVGQPVVVAGTWLPEATFSVTDRPGGPEGADGSWVVTPLLVDGGDAALLVVRGWIHDPATAPPPPSGAAELVAWLQPPDGSATPDPDPRDDVLPALRVAEAAQRVRQDLYGAYAVVADKVAPGDWPAGADATNAGTQGLSPADPTALPPVGRFTALRNLLYGLEWWVFGGFAAFIWWRHVRDLRAGWRAEEEGRERLLADAVPSEP